MKKILLWDRRFPDRKPTRLDLDDALASIFVRAGIAAAVDPAEAGALSVGGSIRSSAYSDVVIWSGPIGRRIRVSLPYAAAKAVIGAGVGVCDNSGSPPITARRNSAGGFIFNSMGGYVLSE